MIHILKAIQAFIHVINPLTFVTAYKEARKAYRNSKSSGQ